MKNERISKTTKMKIHRAAIRPAVTYIIVTD